MPGNGTHAVAGYGPAICVGVGLFAGLGAVLVGGAATLNWPVVGTFFGAVEGASIGSVVGAVDAVAMVLLVRRARSRPAVLTASGVIAGLAALAAARTYAGPIDVPRALVAGFILVAALAGAAFGPLIAYGMPPVRGGGRVDVHVPLVVGRVLAWGAGLGAASGAVTGLVIGIRTHLQTSPFAVVEGAVLGVVSGTVLACLAAAFLLVVRLRPRR